MPEACVEVSPQTANSSKNRTTHLPKNERQIDWNRSNSIDVISYIPLLNQRNATIDSKNSQHSTNDSSSNNNYYLNNNNNKNENDRNGLCCCAGDSSDEFSSKSCWQLKRKQIIWESSHASAKNRTPPSMLRQNPERTTTFKTNAETNIKTTTTTARTHHGEERRQRRHTPAGGNSIARQVNMLSTSLPSTPNLGQLRRRFGHGQEQPQHPEQWVQYWKLNEPQRGEQEQHNFVDIKRQLQMSATKLQTYANVCKNKTTNGNHNGTVPGAEAPELGLAKNNNTGNITNGNANVVMCAKAMATTATGTTNANASASASATPGITISTQTQTDLALLTRYVDNSATSITTKTTNSKPTTITTSLSPQLGNFENEKSSLTFCENCCESLSSLITAGSVHQHSSPPKNGGHTKTKINSVDSHRYQRDRTESVFDLSLQHFVTDEDRTKQKRPNVGSLSDHNRTEYIEYRNKKKKINEEVSSSRSFVDDTTPPTICCYTIDTATATTPTPSSSAVAGASVNYKSCTVVEYTNVDSIDDDTSDACSSGLTEYRHILRHEPRHDGSDSLLSTSLPIDYGNSGSTCPKVLKTKNFSRIPRAPPVPLKPKSSDQPTDLYDPQTFQRKIHKFEFQEDRPFINTPNTTAINTLERSVSPEKCELLNCFKVSSIKPLQTSVENITKRENEQHSEKSPFALESEYSKGDRSLNELNRCYEFALTNAKDKCAIPKESEKSDAISHEPVVFNESNNNNNYNCKISQRRRQPVANYAEPYLTSTLPKRALRYDSHGRLKSNSPVVLNGRGKSLSETPNLGRKVYNPSASDKLREETETEIEQEIAQENYVQNYGELKLAQTNGVTSTKPLTSLPPLPLTLPKRSFQYDNNEPLLNHNNNNIELSAFGLKSNFVGSDNSLPCKCSCKHLHSPQSPTSNGPQHLSTPTSPLTPTSPTSSLCDGHPHSHLFVGQHQQTYNSCGSPIWLSTETIESRCSNCSDQTTIFHLDNEHSSSCTSPSSSGGHHTNSCSNFLKGPLLVKRIPVIQSFGYIPTHSGSLGSANVREGSEKEYTMEKRRNTLERFQRLSFLARRTSPANNASSSVSAQAQQQQQQPADSSNRTRKSSEKSEKLKELTELLRHGGSGNSSGVVANRSSPTPPPIPPPRKPRNGSHSASGSFEKPDAQTAKASEAPSTAASTMKTSVSIDSAPLSFMSTHSDDILLMDQDEQATTSATPAQEHLPKAQNVNSDHGQHIGNNIANPLLQPAAANTNEKHSLTSSAKRLYDTLKPNASLSSFESMMALGREKSKSPPPVHETGSPEIATQLSRPEARTVIGSYAQKGIPFRSASFSQIDYTSGKYKKSALSALADRLRRDKTIDQPNSVVGAVNLTLPRKKESMADTETEPIPKKEPDWIHVPLKKTELSINLNYAAMENKPSLEDVLESPDVIPEEDVFCTDTESKACLTDVRSSVEPFITNLAAHAKMESLTDTIQSENDYIIEEEQLPVTVSLTDENIVDVSSPDEQAPNLATLMEEQIPMESPPDNFLQTATTCMIPVPVYECAAQEWGMENPPAEWVEVTPEELGLIPTPIEPLRALAVSGNVMEVGTDKVDEEKVDEVKPTVISVAEVKEIERILVDNETSDLQTVESPSSPTNYPTSPVDTTLPTISVSRSSEEVEDKSILRRKDDSGERRQASLDHGEVKKRYSHDDIDIGKEMRSSLEGIATRHSADERKRIDKSKRRKGMYFDNAAWSDSPDGSSSTRGLALDISIANLHAIKPDSTEDVVGFEYLNSPATDDNRTPASLYSFDLNTPESECTKPPIWSSATSKTQRLTNFSCHSSEEKDDAHSVVSGGLPRYNKSFPYLHADSISDNESDRTPPPSRDRTSPSPAPSDSDFKRYSKRPLRGPYGQMLEAEMKKPNRMHFEEILEELRESDFNTSQPRRQRTVQDDASIVTSSGGGGGVYDGGPATGGNGGRTNMPQYSSSMRVRKTYLPVPAHTRAASTPSQMENVSPVEGHLATSSNVTTKTQTQTQTAKSAHDQQRLQSSMDCKEDCSRTGSRGDDTDAGTCHTVRKDGNTSNHHHHKHQHQHTHTHSSPIHSQNQREKRAASEAPAPKTHHSKRSQSMSGDKASHLQQATLQHKRSMDSAASSGKSTTTLPAAANFKQPETIEPTQELLASLLQGSSEKLLSEQRQQMFADTRTHVVHEIFRNEQSYVDSLQTVVVKYFRVLKSPEAAGMIESRTVDEIFFMVPDILKIHEKFLADLRSRLDSWNATQKVGDTFMETFSKLEVLEVYTSFVNNCNRAKNAIRSTKHQRPSFARFLESTSREHKGKLTLDNLLIKPVQKFPNYLMLFQRLIKETEQDHPDQKYLQDVLKLVHDILVHINCKEREILENDQREAVLRELEGVIEGITDLTAPDRQFMLFDLVSMPSGQGARKERGFFLFNDLLVLTSIKKRSGTIRKPNTTTCPGTVASTLDTNKYKFLTKISLDCLEIVKTKDENVKRIMSEIENLAEDCNKLQQLTEITATLKYPHQSLEDVIRELHRDVQRQLSERQTNDTQLNMLELLVYSPNGSQKLTIVFSKAEKRTQWEETFSEAKQKLAATMERHPIPEFLTSIPIRKTRAGLQFTCAAATLSEKRDVWVCNSDGYVGQVCIMSLHPEPNVTSCNGVCNARILCVASVPAYTASNTNSTASASTGEQSSENQQSSQTPAQSHSQSTTPQHSSYTQKLRDYRKSISPNCHQPNERGSLSATATPEPKKKLTPLSGGSSISAGNTASNSNSDIQLDLNLSSSDEEAEAAAAANLSKTVERVPSPAPSLHSQVTSTSSSATLTAVTGSPYHSHQDSNVEESEGNQSTMWIGTEDGCIHVYNSTDNIRIKKNRIKIEHHSAVYSILYLDNRVFVSLANGDICVYLRDGLSGWNTSSSHCLSIGTVTSPVTKLLNVHGKLWCSIQGIIKVLDIETLLVVNQIQISSDSKPITNMTVSNNYVWISIHTSAHIKCFHSNTHQLITEVNLAPAVNKMLSNCDEIIRQHKAACLRVTSLLSCKDLIWIGTSAGVLLTIPAQGYEKGQTNVVPTGIPHGHTGHVRFLTFVETAGMTVMADGTSGVTVAKETDSSSSDYKSSGSKSSKAKNESSNILIISGGDGYEDFRNSGANSLSEIAGREDSTNHLLIWQI